MVNRESLYNRVVSSFCTYGYHDVQTAIDHLNTAGQDPEELYAICKDVADNCDINIDELDCVAEVFVYLRDLAIDELQLETSESWGYPQNYLNVACNFMCTSFDASDNTLEKLNEHLNQLEDFDIEAISPVVKWLFEELNFDYEPKETK